MSFLNPLFLFAMLTVAVPLLIYLLNLRKPKKVRFSTLAFFESLKSTSLKRIRIKRWLLLAIRCLAIIMLVVAASRPFLPPDLVWQSDNQPKVIGILIDNSPSMQRVDQNGPYLEQARGLAEEIAEMAGNEDHILLERTNGESLNMPFLQSRQSLNRIGEIEILPGGNYLPERLLDMAGRVEEAREPNKIIYLITDGQETQFNSLAETTLEELSDINIQVMHLGDSEPGNSGFRSVELLPGQNERIRLQAVLENFGGRPVQNQFLNVVMDDELITQQPFELGPGESTTFETELPASEGRFLQVELQIEGDEITFDNTFRASVEMPETREILVLQDPGAATEFTSYLEPVLEVSSEENKRFAVTFEQISGFDVSRFDRYNAVILDGVRNIPDYLSQALMNHVQSGAGLLFLPAANGNLNSYNRLLGIGGAGQFINISGSYGSFSTIDRMAPPAEGHPVLETIFDLSGEEEIRLNVPEIFYYYEIESAGRFGVNILTTATGNPLVREVPAGNGRIIYSAIGSDPGWSNFPVKPFFAPFFSRVVNYLSGGGNAKLNTHMLGEPFEVLVQSSPETIQLEKNNEVIIPDTRQTFQGTRVLYPGREWIPGWLTLKAGEDSLLFSVNQNTMESQLRSLEQESIKQLLNNIFSNVSYLRAGNNQVEMMAQLEIAAYGKEVWYWFIVFAIILLMSESLISRAYKAESIS